MLPKIISQISSFYIKEKKNGYKAEKDMPINLKNERKQIEQKRISDEIILRENIHKALMDALSAEYILKR